MNIKFLTVFAVISFLAFTPFSVSAENELPNRYFVKSKSSFWKNSFGARNVFDESFTADLSEWQVRVGKLFGLEIEPVGLFFILPESDNPQADGRAETEKLDSTPRESGVKGKGRQTERILPSDQTPWGIEDVYKDSAITKTSGGKDITVAVLDTGVFSSHPDLKNRISSCKDFTHSRNPIVDGKCEDKNGHGTHVSGIIAADGGEDALGIYGIAPEANLAVYKVCSASGICYADDIAVALKTAADNGANVVNLSLGSDSQSFLISDAINYASSKGVLVVAAAGNDGPYFESIDYPAATASVVGVGAFDVNLLLSDWSSRGINSSTEPYVKEEKDIEFAMPGVNIESAWKDGGYVILSGTSMASPHLAGLAAKLWQFSSDNPADSTRELLRQYARDIDVLGDDDASGWGFSTLP